MELGEAEVPFRAAGGQAKRIGSRDVFLILEGKIETHTEAEAIRTRMKFSLAATVLTGGIPIWRRVREKTKALSLRAERFVRLYDRKSSEPSVEIIQDRMDYSFLGIKMASSSFANFSTVVMKIRELFPQAIFDDRLMKSFEANVSPTECGMTLRSTAS